MGPIGFWGARGPYLRAPESPVSVILDHRLLVWHHCNEWFTSYDNQIPFVPIHLEFSKWHSSFPEDKELMNDGLMIKRNMLKYILFEKRIFFSLKNIFDTKNIILQKISFPQRLFFKEIFPHEEYFSPQRIFLWIKFFVEKNIFLPAHICFAEKNILCGENYSLCKKISTTENAHLP